MKSNDELFEEFFNHIDSLSRLKRYLTQKGNPNIRNSQGYSLIEIAVKKNLNTWVFVLLRSGASLESKEHDPIALNVLKNRNYCLFNSLFISAKLNMYEIDRKGMNAVQYLASGRAGDNSIRILKKLYCGRMQQENFGVINHPLILSALNKRYDIYNFLQNYLVYRPEVTLYSYVILGLHVYVEEFLKANNFINDIKYQAMIIAICRNEFFCFNKIVQTLDQSSLSAPHSFNQSKKTPLHFAAISNSLGCCLELLKLKADVAALDSEGKVPAEYLPLNASRLLAFFKRASTIQLLEAVRDCVEGVGKKVVILLKKCGADPNVKCVFTGNTALHYAINGCNNIAIGALLEFGADENLRNKLGITPKQLAKKRLQQETECSK